MNEELFDVLEMSDYLCEIVSADESCVVPTDPRVNIAELTKDDDSPMFATVEIIRNGKSRNRRNYPADLVMKLKEQVVGIVSYQGHSDPSQRGFEFREPQGIFVGASVTNDGDKVRLLGKQYIFKTSSLREWLPKSIACGNPMSVSIQGSAKCTKRVDGSIDVLEIVNLESIDWCNAGTQGCPNSLNLSLTTEMVERSEEMLDDVKVVEEVVEEPTNDPIIEEVTEEPTNEVTEEVSVEDEENPVAEEVVEEPTEDKVVEIAEEPTVEPLSEMEVKISEMEALITEKDTLIAELEAEILGFYKKEKLAEVREEDRAIFESRLTGTTKEEIDSQLTEMVEFAKAIRGFDNQPVGAIKKNNTASDEDIKEQVIRLFGGNR